VRRLAAHPQLFAVENHGDSHLAPVIGPGRTVYGVTGAADGAALRREIEGGARAVVAAGLPPPAWYRGATARYDRAALQEIRALGYRIAGFSVNGDVGATLSRRAVAERIGNAGPGDIILLHVNKPDSQSAEGLRDALPGMLARGLRFVTLRGREVQGVVADR
jgi:peptidoglycan/xylan/chitin deacetylase (PgdA/CDA1 family)